MIVGCSDSSNNFPLEIKGSSDATVRSGDTLVNHRMRINDDYSMVVTTTYTNDILSDIDYTIDNQLSSDFYYILDLRTDTSGTTIYSFARLNPNISSTSFGGNLLQGIDVSGGSVTEYFCECNNANDKDIDCILRQYYNETYCDGNFCSACSVVVDWGLPSLVFSTSNSSYIIFPSNL